MKKFTLIILLLLSLNNFAQNDTSKFKFKLYVSGGLHAGVFGYWYGYKSVPFILHIEGLVKEKNVLGIRYSNDVYNADPFDLSFSVRVPVKKRHIRHNLHIRYYRYFKEEDRRVSWYLGGSLGCSYWQRTKWWELKGGLPYTTQQTSYIPSAQFIFGCKVKINDTFFSQTELSIGSPFNIQTSLGAKF